jgi:hypothetical protein
MENKATLAEILRDLNLNLSTNPKGTDKGSHKTYISGFYEAEFGRRRNKKNRLLEVGVRTGASIALWANYFKDIEIFGLDIESVGSSAGPMPEYLDYPNVKFLCTNAYDPAVAKDLDLKFSILIDDGPHSLASQKEFIDLYLSKLTKDGVLIIEDIQGGYFHCYELMKRLPKGFAFEIYNFSKKSGAYDDVLFVVRCGSDVIDDYIRKKDLVLRCFILRVKGFCKKIVNRILKKM